MPGGDFEGRELDFAEIELEVDHVGDTAGVFDGGGTVALEALPDIVGRQNMVALVHVVFFGAELVEGHVEAHGHHHAMGIEVAGIDEVAIAGRD